MNERRGMGMTVRQWALGIGLMTVVATGLTACGGQSSAPATTAPPTTAPVATTLPAATVAASPTAAASPTVSSAAVASPAVGGAVSASPVVSGATSASPVSSGAVSATPVVGGAENATPVAGGAAQATPRARGRASGTPVAQVNAERLSADCADYNAWRNTPDVKAALDKVSLWPAVIAEGEKAAAGQPVDKAAMQKDFDQMSKLATQLRTSSAEGDHAPLQLSGRAMGLTSRLAGGLATGSLDAKAAGAAVTEAKAAIADYQDDAAQREAACGG